MMTDSEQKRVFSKNLRFYIEYNGKQQKEVAEDLGVNPSTLNMWCKGNSIPGMGKIQRIADYFGIGKSDLVDDKLDSDPYFDAMLLNDMETLNLIKKYYKLPKADKDIIQNMIELLYKKITEN